MCILLSSCPALYLAMLARQTVLSVSYLTSALASLTMYDKFATDFPPDHFADYRFDDRKPDAPVLKINFARFPFRLPAAEDDKKRNIMR
jgi:hypothetical protein